MTVPESSNSEVIIADGTCPAGGNPYEMKWVLLHNQADEPTKTQVVNVMELYRANPLIRSVRPLQLSGEDESGFEPYGCVIELNNGRTDTIFASADGAVLRAAPGGFEFAGRFGLYSEHNGLPTHVALIGGTRLTRNGIGIATDSAEYRGTITAVDRPEQSITVSPAPDCLDALVGRYIYITNPVRRIAYKVLEARSVAAGAELRLEFDSRIGTGKVSGHDANLVNTSTPFPLSRYRYYHGARLLNAAGTAEYRLIEVRSDRGAIIDASVHPEAAADKLAVEFPTDTWFEVYDYGVGDEVVFPHACSVTLTGLSACDITATTKLTATLLYHSGVRTVKAFRGSAG